MNVASTMASGGIVGAKTRNADVSSWWVLVGRDAIRVRTPYHAFRQLEQRDIRVGVRDRAPDLHVRRSACVAAADGDDARWQTVLRSQDVTFLLAPAPEHVSNEDAG